MEIVFGIIATISIVLNIFLFSKVKNMEKELDIVSKETKHIIASMANKECKNDEWKVRINTDIADVMEKSIGCQDRLLRIENRVGYLYVEAKHETPVYTSEPSIIDDNTLDEVAHDIQIGLKDEETTLTIDGTESSM